MPPNLPFPRIYVLSAHLTEEELHQLQNHVSSLTLDASEADVFVGKLSRAERAKLELRQIGIATADARQPQAPARVQPTTPLGPAAKRRKVEERKRLPSPIVISSSSDDEAVAPTAAQPLRRGSPLTVVRLAWLTDSIARGEVLPMDSYVVYKGRRRRTEPARATAASRTTPRASPPSHGPQQQQEQRQTASSSPLRPTRQWSAGASRRKTFGKPVQAPPLVRTTTSEHDEAAELPPIPAFLHTTYSCQRPTPLHPPNEAFVEALKTIRTARRLTGDQIGIRAYSTAIATIAAYPYKLAVPDEVSRLPGCGPKIAALFRQFLDTGGHVREAEDDEADARLTVLRLFHNIWGVAEATARAFYNRGWRDLDDVIEFGWKDLSRVQQIGVKYYDELQTLLPRAEVEAIAERVREHADAICPGFQVIIAGGYRRGKELSGDVDVLLSHRDEAATELLIGRLVVSLEEAGLITHTLTLSTANSERGQEAVRWKGNAPSHGLASGAGGGSGFDTLDKALVVWQDPMVDDEGGRGGAVGESEAGGQAGGQGSAKRHNTNPHRRVDIIVSPWKTVGCALLGWSGGTTFQRDLRRYCKHERNLRFDSSGARSRVDGSWVDLEDSARDPAPDMLTAERRVFAALGLEFRPPNERCTG